MIRHTIRSFHHGHYSKTQREATVDDVPYSIADESVAACSRKVDNEDDIIEV
jgi:hypothetical protein